MIHDRTTGVPIEACGKLAHPSRAHAIVDMDRMKLRWAERGMHAGEGKEHKHAKRAEKEKGDRAGRWTLAYHCPRCLHWHLTSQPPRD